MTCGDNEKRFKSKVQINNTETGAKQNEHGPFQMLEEGSGAMKKNASWERDDV